MSRVEIVPQRDVNHWHVPSRARRAKLRRHSPWTSAVFIRQGTVANLADVAGSISIRPLNTAPEGCDESKLENGVLEPLRQLGLIDCG